MLQIESLEDDVHKRATIVSQECGNSMVDHLLKIMEENVVSSKASRAERRARLSAQVNAIHTQDTLEAALGYHHPGTCDWALQLDVFRQWKAEDAKLPKLLWIHGPAGFGKTIMSAWIIQHLKTTYRDQVSYFFCVADNERTRDPYASLRSWLSKALENDTILDVLERALNGRKRDGPLTHSELWELFAVVGQICPGYFFILDGFDECTNIAPATGYHKDDSRNNFLRDLARHLPAAQARVLVVSRDVADIREYLGDDSMHDDGLSRLEYRITPEDTEADVRVFSTCMVDRKLSRKKEELRRQIATEAAVRSEGMFLWIQLLEKEISPGQNAKQLKETVQGMPSGISEAYARELERIDRLQSRDRKQAIMILRWVLFAVRPLQVKELAEALIVSENELDAYPEDDLPDEWEECFVDEDYVKTRVLGLCGSLLRLHLDTSHSSIANNTVHFVHFSVREYLTSRVTENPWAAKLGFGDASAEMNVLSRVCLRYLTLDVFNDIPSNTEIYPFLSYASWAWYFHSFHQKPRPSKDIMDSTKRAFDPASTSWRVWTPLMEQRLIEAGQTGLKSLCIDYGEPAVSTSQSEPSGLTKDTRSIYLEDLPTKVDGEVKNIHLENPIYYASLLGLSDIVEWLADQGLSVNGVGGRFGFPLQAASARDHAEAVAHLLHRGALVDQSGGEFHTALIAAATCASLETVRRLLDAKADLTLLDKKAYTALDYAAMRGATDIVQELLAYGAESTAAARRVACRFGHRRILRLLMGCESSLTPDQKMEDIQALDSAMRYAHFDVAIDVIDSLPAASLSAELANGSTLLVHAAGYRAFPVVQRLLHHPDPARRVAVNWTNSKGWSALHEACNEGDLQVVLALLDAGAVVAQGDSKLEMTVLQVAAYNGHCNIIRALSDHGAEIDQKTRGAITALRIAVDAGSMEAVEALLGLGASMYGIDENRGTQHTLYEFAVYRGEYEIADLLLVRGCLGATEEHTISGPGVSHGIDRHLPLLASRKDHEAGDLQLLLAQHGDFSKELLGETLRIAAFAGHTSSVEHLLDRGAPLNARDMNGRTALHFAAQRGHEEVCNILLKSGAAIGIEDDNGSTPIDLAVRYGRRSASFIRCHMTDLMRQIRRRPSLMKSPPVNGSAANLASPLSVRKALSGYWKGEYEYLHWMESLREPWTVEIPGIVDTTKIGDDSMSKGLSEEELAFSSFGADLWGEFAVYGFVDPASFVWFVKLYETYGWLYKGKLSADMKQLRGTWGGSRKLWHGTFTLTISPAKTKESA